MDSVVDNDVSTEEDEVKNRSTENALIRKIMKRFQNTKKMIERPKTHHLNLKTRRKSISKSEYIYSCMEHTRYEP